MHINRGLQATLVCTVMLVLAACSSDSNPAGGAGGGGGGGGGTDPAAALQSVQAQPPTPLQNAANASPTGGAAQGMGYFDQYNALTAFSSWFTPPAPVRGGVKGSPAAPDTVTYTVGNLVVTVVSEHFAMETYSYTSWFVVLNGSDEFGTYDNFLLLTGDNMIDDGGSEIAGSDRDVSNAKPAGFVGSMLVYDRANQQSSFLHNFTWSQTSGVTHFSYSGSLFVNPEDIQINFNADFSGSLSFSQDGVLRYTASWSATGSGTWTSYDDQGVQDGTGTF